VKRRVGVLRFPGTNCDRDVWRAVEDVGGRPQWLWHADLFDPAGFDAFVVPGGFSYGDYLRCGALAAKAPAMQSLSHAVQRGAPVLGICNGFQILCEAQLLPGALLRNEKGKFIDKWVELSVQNAPRWSSGSKGDAQMRLPIAHGEGRFHVDGPTWIKMQELGQVWLSYLDNPNGSVHGVAGVMDVERRVAGLMPHPERAMAEWLGGTDGRAMMEALVHGA
jgi:phosphoribosylformylglycinamidine synthase subunit PurQ / glutaminase